MIVRYESFQFMSSCVLALVLRWAIVPTFIIRMEPLLMTPCMVLTFAPVDVFLIIKYDHLNESH